MHATDAIHNMVYYDDAFGLSRQYGSGFVTPLPGVPISVPVSVPTPCICIGTSLTLSSDIETHQNTQTMNSFTLLEF